MQAESTAREGGASIHPCRIARQAALCPSLMPAKDEPGRGCPDLRISKGSAAARAAHKQAAAQAAIENQPAASCQRPNIIMTLASGMHVETSEAITAMPSTGFSRRAGTDVHQAIVLDSEDISSTEQLLTARLHFPMRLMK